MHSPSSIKITFPVNLPYKFLPMFIHFNESISQVLKGELFAVLIDLKDFSLVNQLVGMKINCLCNNNLLRQFLITSVGIYQGSAFTDQDQLGGFTVILNLSDDLYQLGYNKIYRCFNNMSVVNIIKQILSKYNISSDFNNLSSPESYNNLTIKIQYGESDLTFLQRIVGEYNIFFLWRDKKLMFYNNSSSLDFVELDKNAFQSLQHIFQFNRLGYFTSRAETLQVKSYDYTNSRYSEKQFKQDLIEPTYSEGVVEKITYGNNNSTASIITQSRNTYQYIINDYKFSIGQIFAYGAEKIKYTSTNSSYLFVLNNNLGRNITAQQFIVNNISFDFDKNILQLLWKTQGYFSVNQCVLIKQVISLSRPIVKPIASVQTAIVINPTEESQLTNHYGDVLIRFLWDTTPIGQVDIYNACWARVSQLMAGDKYGVIVIPRNGQEVLVDFLHGDIDQPVVIGSLINGNNLPFYDKSPNKISIKTNALSKANQGDKYNELTFDDLDDKQSIYMRAQKNMELDIIEGDLSIKSMGKNNTNNSITIANGNLIIKIENGEYKGIINGDCSLNVQGDLHCKVTNNINFQCDNYNIKTNNYQVEARDAINLKTNQLQVNSSTAEITSSNVMLNWSKTTIKGIQLDILTTSLHINSPSGIDMLTANFSVVSAGNIKMICPIGTLHGFPPYYI